MITTKGDGNVGIVQGDMTVDKRPRYKDVTIVKGSSEDSFIPLHNSQDESTATKSLELLQRLLSNEQIEPDEAFGEIFSIMTPLNSGTAVSILEDATTSDPTISESPSFKKAKGLFLNMVKVRVLEGPHTGKIGWVSVATISTERRLISDE